MNTTRGALRTLSGHPEMSEVDAKLRFDVYRTGMRVEGRQTNIHGVREVDYYLSYLTLRRESVNINAETLEGARCPTRVQRVAVTPGTKFRLAVLTSLPEPQCVRVQLAKLKRK
ncbi:hypothetical protein EVAR_64146_1 [Eumeta japonica]|uniref:Uncharacterized protein n=1 Tax=Eumeta variegata TaxID=151549 RepID=A0A4C1ZZD8_EUMVA|nr:hypothetical protein EVAR_64146_1 [Eumeta japonica]